MISMKKDKKEANSDLAVAMKEEAYPYGLELHLGSEELAKLGIEEDVDVEQEVFVMAKAKVESVSSRKMAEGDTERNMSLQITDMKVSTEKETKLAKALYGEKKD